MKLAIAIIILLVTTSCSKDTYIGFLYPNKSNLSDFRITGEYTSLNDCLDDLNRRARANSSYECGKNCDRSRSPMVCESTTGNEK